MKTFISLSIILLSISGVSQTKLPKELKKSYTFIPAGQSVIDGDTLAFQSYYMSATEISNHQYNQFLTYLKEHDKIKELAYCKVDSVKWNFGRSYNKPYETFYHSHIAYSDYPVVNISYEAALEYCEWLNIVFEDLNEEYKYEFSLPTQVEWIRAAHGNKFFTKYSWNSPFLRKSTGEHQANFIHFSESMVRFNEEKKEFELMSPTLYEPDIITDFADVLAPVLSYWPSSLGLYNMNGNASEMVLEKGIAFGGSWCSGGYDIRNESFINYTEPKPTVGFRPMLKVSEK